MLYAERCSGQKTVLESWVMVGEMLVGQEQTYGAAPLRRS